MPNWFNTTITTGERNLDERVSGLDSLRRNIKTYQNAAPVTILDVGCAEGLISDWLGESNSIVTGVEGDPDKVATAKKLFPKQHFILGNANDISQLLPQDAKYDVILLLAILQKLDNPMPLLLDALNRATKTVAIRVPDYWFKHYWTPEFYATIRPDWFVAHHAPAAENDEQFLGHLLILHRHHVPKELAAMRKAIKVDSKIQLVAAADFNVVSFPKSGRTWLRYYLATWLNLEYDKGFDLEFMPQPYWSTERRAVQFPHINFTHDFFDLHQDDDEAPIILHKEVYDKKPTILLVRNPFDTVVSYYFHKAKREGAVELSLNEFILSSRYGIGRYCEWMTQMLDYTQTNPRVLVLSYEEMRKSMSKQIRKMFAYMGVEDHDDHIPIASKLSSFKLMQEAEIAANSATSEGIGRLAMSNWDGDIQKLKVRKGEVGSWKDEIDEHTQVKLLEDPRVKVYLARLRAICPASAPL